jgi:hypothetical protein
MANVSAVAYRRMKNSRNNLRVLPDLAETGGPRYGNKVLLSHRRGQKRLSTWVKYKTAEVNVGRG